MSWKDETYLRDIDDNQPIGATCTLCLHAWRVSPIELKLRVAHGNVTFSEVEKNLSCPRRYCTNVGARVMLIPQEDNSGFVAGMP